MRSLPCQAEGAGPALHAVCVHGMPERAAARHAAQQASHHSPLDAVGDASSCKSLSQSHRKRYMELLPIPCTVRLHAHAPHTDSGGITPHAVSK